MEKGAGTRVSFRSLAEKGQKQEKSFNNQVCIEISSDEEFDEPLPVDKNLFYRLPFSNSTDDSQIDDNPFIRMGVLI